jgi:hypothetical protein
MTLESPGLGQAQNMVGLNQLMGSQPSPLDNWISNRNTYKQMMKKTAQICFHSKRQHIITNMNDNKNMDSTISGPVFICI